MRVLIMTVAKVDSVREMYLRKLRAETGRKGKAGAIPGCPHPVAGTGEKLWSGAYEAVMRGDDPHRAGEMRFN